MITDTLRLEAGLMTPDERLRYAAELLADAAQTDGRPTRQALLRTVVRDLRVAVMTR